MIKIGTTDVEKIKVGEDDAFVVKVGNDVAWTAPVRFYLKPKGSSMPSAVEGPQRLAWASIETANAFNSTVPLRESIVKRIDSINPDVKSELESKGPQFLELKPEGALVGNSLCYYCDVYYGDTLEIIPKALPGEILDGGGYTHQRKICYLVAAANGDLKPEIIQNSANTNINTTDHIYYSYTITTAIFDSGFFWGDLEDVHSGWSDINAFKVEIEGITDTKCSCSCPMAYDGHSYSSDEDEYAYVRIKLYDSNENLVADSSKYGFEANSNTHKNTLTTPLFNCEAAKAGLTYEIIVSHETYKTTAPFTEYILDQGGTPFLHANV